MFIELSAIDEETFQNVKASGGNVRIKYRTFLKMREHLYPEKFEYPLREPLPNHV